MVLVLDGSHAVHFPWISTSIETPSERNYLFLHVCCVIGLPTCQHSQSNLNHSWLVQILVHDGSGNVDTKSTASNKLGVLT